MSSESETTAAYHSRGHCIKLWRLLPSSECRRGWGREVEEVSTLPHGVLASASSARSACRGHVMVDVELPPGRVAPPRRIWRTPSRQSWDRHQVMCGRVSYPGLVKTLAAHAVNGVQPVLGMSLKRRVQALQCTLVWPSRHLHKYTASVPVFHQKFTGP
ncbi:hypothetical protein BS47DRAFT_1396866 [Hydnum rufescens UP504]|uniref:Uncharacterized protein n=1 Tax=Hydnum rufescens UP504 TaxID=1448309 RepID=A0A9P6DSF6_9AGAM|nr:hypothetical protein BS47DRAFT_1396866 [Hydnum rufescens UP504]